MKKILISITAVFLTLTPLAAQKGFQTDSVFTLKMKNQVVESIVSGSKLDAYNLDYFRSIRFRADEPEIDKILGWLNADSQMAVDVDKVSSDGQVVYMLLRFSGKKPDKWQYLGFQQKMTEGSDDAFVTVVYMRGKATPEDLSKIFKHRTVK
jgi:hypothetical protein